MQAENSALQFFSCAVTAFWSSLSLQPLHSRSYHQDLSWSLNRPDGRDEGGEVVVAPAVASLGAVVLHHLALVHHPLERHLRVYAGGDLATPWSTLICSDEERQLTSVMFGSGMFSVEQAVFTLASQPLRSAARAVKFFAPLLVVDPWHDSAALFPPPDLKVVFRLFVGPVVFLIV